MLCARDCKNSFSFKFLIFADYFAILSRIFDFCWHLFQYFAYFIFFVLQFCFFVSSMGYVFLREKIVVQNFFERLHEISEEFSHSLDEV